MPEMLVATAQTDDNGVVTSAIIVAEVIRASKRVMHLRSVRGTVAIQAGFEGYSPLLDYLEEIAKPGTEFKVKRYSNGEHYLVGDEWLQYAVVLLK